MESAIKAASLKSDYIPQLLCDLAGHSQSRGALHASYKARPSWFRYSLVTSNRNTKDESHKKVEPAAVSRLHRSKQN